MSISGVRSSQGDGYQTLIAMRSVVEMLHNEEILEVEVDSTSLDRSGHPIVVDDVVVRYRSGRCDFFQVKKNQVDSQSWAIADLADDLRKAWLQWEREPGCKIRFVSRSPFGALGKLVDYASIEPSYAAFAQGLTRGHEKTLGELLALREIVGTSQDALDFLRCVTLEVCDPSMLKESLRGQLGIHVAHKDTAYKLLSNRVDGLARRDQAAKGGSAQAISHSFTRQELLTFLGDQGIQIGAAKSQQLLEVELRRISAIGRDWNRTIGGKPIARSAVDDVLGKIENKVPMMILAAGPGIGKTCLLLDVLESLESTSQSFPVFLQTRVFADAAFSVDRASMGLPDSLCSDIARLSEQRHVTVIIDSLDVLSLARAHHSLSYFLSLIDRLRVIPNVSVVAACRSFDLKYDQKLSVRQWGDTIELNELDWQSDVQPLLREWGVLDSIPGSIKPLLCNPRLLALFHDIVKTGDLPTFSTAQQLSEIYLDRIVTRNPLLGDLAMQQLGKLASLMLQERRLDVPRANVGISTEIVRQLLSIGVLIEVTGNRLSFGHQTLLDVLAVSASLHDGTTLADFIRSKAQVPFLRPTIRAFFFHLQVNDPVALRRQVRAVFDAPDIAFHLKRLVAESIAEISPVEEDWRLIRHVYQKHRPLFEWLHQRAGGVTWCRFFHKHWLPLIRDAQEGALVLRHLEQLAAHPNLSDELLTLWQQVLAWDWVSKSQVVWISGHLLDRFANWQNVGLRAIFERLIELIEDDHDALGKSLSVWVEATDSNDDLLWRYIMRRTGDADKIAYDLGGKLVCSPHVFCRESFLADRMSKSNKLLETALKAVEEWSTLKGSRYLNPRNWSGEFLAETSHGRVHSKRETHHFDALNVLMNAIEQACSHNAETQSPWWLQNVQRLQQSHEGALRYFAVKAITGFPEANSSHALITLLDEEMLEGSLRWEVSLLLGAVYLNLTVDQQVAIQDLVIGLYQRHTEDVGANLAWVLCARRELLVRIPAHHRSAQAFEVLNLAEKLRGLHFDAPNIQSWGGRVHPPISLEAMAELSEKGILRLLTYYQSPPQSTTWEEDEAGNMIGGADQVDMQLRELASRYPERCLRWLTKHWLILSPAQRKQILVGVGSHLKYRFGNLSSSGWSLVEEPEGTSVARLLLDELEHHYEFWRLQRESADALLGCADVVDSEADAERIAFLLVSCSMSDEPAMDRGDGDRDELSVAINSTRGVAAEAAIRLANRWCELAFPLPPLLIVALRRYASDEHPSIRALVLRLLPYLLHHHKELGWQLFERAVANGSAGCWKHAYGCLYHNYYNDFNRVGAHLDTFLQAGHGEALKVWAGISSLAYLADRVDFSALVENMKGLDQQVSWAAAAKVFAANLASSKSFEHCINGIMAAFAHAPDTGEVAVEFSAVFRDKQKPAAKIPLNTLSVFFAAMARASQGARNRIYGLEDWLASVASTDPDYGLFATELMIGALDPKGYDLIGGESYLVLLTLLFREAEERELSDSGAFLNRVIVVQDFFLSRGLHKLEDWLRSAEDRA